MNPLFAGPVFTQEDTPAILLALGVFFLLVVIPVLVIIWGLLGLKKGNERSRNKRIAVLVAGALLLFLILSRFNLFGWLLH